MDTVKVKALSPFKGTASERGKNSHVKKGQILEVSRVRAIDLKNAELVEDAPTSAEVTKAAEPNPKGATP